MKILRALIPYLALVLIVITIRFFIVTPVRVNGVSMEPTLHDQDVLLLHKLHGQINRFDVVVVELEDQRLVKRVIGLPNETIKFENNTLYIDGEEVEDNYSIGETFDYSLDELGLTSIPDNQYFVLGDNREDSLDSRIVGPVNKSDVVGKTALRIYPFNKIGNIK